MIAPTTVVLLVALAGFYVAQARPGGMFYRPGGLTCGEVREPLPKYAAGKATPKLAEQLEEHLANCSGCREMYEAMGDRVTAPILRARRDQQPQILAFATPRR